MVLIIFLLELFKLKIIKNNYIYICINILVLLEKNSNKYLKNILLFIIIMDSLQKEPMESPAFSEEITENKFLETKLNQLNELRKNYKLFIIKLNILLLTIDEDTILNDDYKTTIRNYIVQKIEIKQNIFKLYLEMVQYCIDNDDYEFLLQLIKSI